MFDKKRSVQVRPGASTPLTQASTARAMIVRWISEDPS
jgi:hypothetical protein